MEPDQPAPTGLSGSHFSEWLPEPPADPQFLRRVARLRWEKGAAVISIAAIWAGFMWLLSMKHASGLGGLTSPLVMATAAIWTRARSRRASPYLADLLDLPAACPQFPVELTYLVGNLSYGSDAGIVSFVDGWMHFQGRRTSWSLNLANSSLDPSAKKGGFINQSAEIIQTVRWKHLGQDYLIRMISLDQIDGLGGGLRKQFANAIREWRMCSIPSSDAAVLPPLMPVTSMPEKQRSALDKWAYPTYVSLAIFAISVPAYFLITRFPWWPAAVSAVLLFIASQRRAVAAYTLWQLSKLKYVGGERSVVPHRPALSSIRRRLGGAAVSRLLRKSKADLLPRLATVEPATAFPVAIQYTATSQAFRSDVGVLSVVDGTVHFAGRNSNWAIQTGDAELVDPAESSWTAPKDFQQVLKWQHNGATFSASLLPVDSFPGLGSGLAVRMAKALGRWNSAPQSDLVSSIWPPTQPLDKVVVRLERQFTAWSILKQLSHVAWIGGLMGIYIGFPDGSIFGFISLVFGGASLITSEYNRGRIANKLEAIYYYCDGGQETVRFKRGLGPWWYRINKPWVR